MTKLNERQKRFVHEYLVDANATQAYIRAGYSKRGAGQSAERLLKNAEIKKYIEEKIAEMEAKKVATAEEIIQYLTSVIRGESKSEIVVVESCGNGFSKARTMMKAPDEKERLKAAELLGRRYGLFKDNIVMEGEQVIILNDLKE